MASSPPKRKVRFTFILVLAAIATGLAAVGGWRYARASAPINGPIILISIDTLRFDHLPVYGYQKLKTPAINALAADGIVFDRAYSHAPQTLPAHASLLSGRLPPDTGVRDGVGFSLRPGQRLLPQMLRERGYTTGGVVSTHVLRSETGIDQGFDFFDSEIPTASPDIVIGRGQRDGGESEALAERWLDEQRSSRVFLFLHLDEPHKPYAPPARFAQYDPYDGEIAYSDEIVGRLVRYLQANQLYDRSTIVLLSDHGEGLGDHGEQEHGLFVYDEAIHIPLIIKQPGGAGGGRRVRDLVQHVDIAPTLLDLAKAPIPWSLPGRSLKPLLDGTGHLPERAVYAEALYARYHFGWSELTALTDGRYKYINAPREELYDLQRDPHERDNIAEDRRQVRQALRGALDRLSARAPNQAPRDLSPGDRGRLLALGYVGAPTEVSNAPRGTLPDPKDKRELLETYRAAVELAGEGKWRQAIALLQRILNDDPEMAGVWSHLAAFAIRIGRYNQAIDAYDYFIKLRPAEPGGYLGAATTLLRVRKLDEARKYAQLAADATTDRDRRSRASAHELLAKIALAQRDAHAARREADLARQADPTRPVPSYIEARLLYDQGKYAEALPLFEQSIAEIQKSHALQMTDLHFYTADTLVRLERCPEAEAQFIAELRDFPQNTRARAGLATLYHESDRPDQAARVVADLMRITPTPESYALAARLWTILGNRQQANATRADARRAFAETGRSARRPNTAMH